MLLDWLNVVNAELLPERYWRGPKSQEEGDCTFLASNSKMGNDESLQCFINYKWQSHETMSTNHNF